MDNRFLLAQVTDMQVTAESAASLERCMVRLGALPLVPDAVLFTGNLTHAGRPDEYDELARVLAALPMPCFLLPGDRDDPAEMRRKFPSHAYLRQRAGKLDYVLEAHPVRIVALDSTVPGMPHGFLDDEQLAWLDETLRSAPAKPTVVAMHHPPFRAGTGEDAQMLRNPVPLEGVVSRHPQVERVLCGHLGRGFVRRFGGSIASTGPSPPGFELHLWAAGRGLVSQASAFGG